MRDTARGWEVGETSPVLIVTRPRIHEQEYQHGTGLKRPRHVDGSSVTYVDSWFTNF